MCAGHAQQAQLGNYWSNQLPPISSTCAILVLSIEGGEALHHGLLLEQLLQTVECHCCHVESHQPSLQVKHARHQELPFVSTAFWTGQQC